MKRILSLLATSAAFALCSCQSTSSVKSNCCATGTGASCCKTGAACCKTGDAAKSGSCAAACAATPASTAKHKH